MLGSKGWRGVLDFEGKLRLFLGDPCSGFLWLWLSPSSLALPDRDEEDFLSGDFDRCGCVVVFSLPEGDCGDSSSLGGDFFDFFGDLEKKFIEMTGDKARGRRIGLVGQGKGQAGPLTSSWEGILE